jgi:2,3-dihydroxybenzoate-AMP ligase
VAAFKAPDQLVAVDALPLTPVGKVDKKALANRLAE